MIERNAILEQARKVYGSKNQILVCIEELNELACVLAKYPRYTDENAAINDLFDKALDEVADVTIILKHVKAIFNMSEEQLNDRVDKKIARLERWLEHSDSMQETIDDRAVEPTITKDTCQKCARNKPITEKDYIVFCKACLKAQATEGKAPYYMTQE